MRITGGILTTFCLLQISTAYPYFRDKIPNGHLVANPCNISEIWFGVGHKQRYGNGERNQFGLDFQRQGMQWTNDLCRMDSDEDGSTNGAELGDPNCKWVPGGVPIQSQGITHPGVCTDSSGHACKEPGFDLKCDGFQCDAATGTRKLEIRYTQMEVPTQPKTYKCQAFALPTDKDYHLIAATPHISNINHTYYYNEKLASGEVDASGLTLHFTDNLRPNDLGIFRVGLNYLLFIPPKRKRFEVSAVCGGDCMREYSNETITIIGGQSEMFYHGVSGKMYKGKTDGTSEVLFEDSEYHLDSPKLHLLDTPKTLGQGESLGVNCTYDSSSENKTLLYGIDVNSTEVCFGHILYYPKEGSIEKGCTTIGDLDQCEIRDIVAQCEHLDIVGHLNKSHPALKEIFDNCMFGRCLQECVNVSEKYSTHPCFSGSLKDFLVWTLSLPESDDDFKTIMLDFWGRLDSCKTNNGNDKHMTSISSVLPCYGHWLSVWVLVYFVFV
ncbi:TEMPT-like protein [Mya arenaria]|uniref:TEMPT-like protein n=1 Tax=Mya arenaria TaxID=6604 RepID=A0ABY7EP27_MYAAR|nr:TEMPT-like protein [Mya arenaria]